MIESKSSVSEALMLFRLRRTVSPTI